MSSGSDWAELLGTDIPRDVDTERLAVQALKAEGVFLHRARLASDALRQRLASSHPKVQTFRMTREELETLVKQFSGAVDIGVEYHLGATDVDAA